MKLQALIFLREKSFFTMSSIMMDSYQRVNGKILFQYLFSQSKKVLYKIRIMLMINYYELDLKKSSQRKYHIEIIQ